MTARRRVGAGLLAVAGLVAACSSTPGAEPPAPSGPVPPAEMDADGDADADDVPATDPTPAPAASEPPDWLGTRVLEAGPEGYAEAQPTPPELVDRRLTSPDHLPPPPDDTYRSEVSPVPDEVLGRSTWSEACPVAADELRYVTVSFWGFDGRPHTGELLVHRDVAADVGSVFGELHRARFPLEEVRITAPEELDAPPTGDGNVTSAFVCRPVRGSTSWSAHASGRAIDVNPFHNPYQDGDVVLPELATAYTDRDELRPGMIVSGDEVVAAFAAIGWSWGGAWDRPVDPMHFSADGG